MAEKRQSCIDARMTVLDIVSRYRCSEAVFWAWNRRAGECICCRALFDTLQQAADRYGLDLERLSAELDAAASGKHIAGEGRQRAGRINILSGRTIMTEKDVSSTPPRLTETVRGAG